MTSGKAVHFNLNGQDNKAGRYGSISITATEVKDSDTDVLLSISARDLDKKDFFGKSDPFYEFHRQNADGTWSLVYRSIHLKKNLNPHWPTVEIPLSQLAAKTAMQTQLLIRVFDHDDDGSHDLIGEASVVIESMKAGLQLPLIHPKNAKKAKHSGMFIVNNIQFIPRYSFLDYLSTGTHLNLMVSIDFTGSNGDPRDRNSLHFINPQQMNQYQNAIWATGSILEYYDTDKRFPVYGFGAQFPNGVVSHMFALTGNVNVPEVQGVQGILDVYARAIQGVKLWGPTNFAPTLQQVSQHVRAVESSSPAGSNYFVLLILTDGEVTDMQDTIDAIVAASELPLSIVIVGVGNADFGKMNLLDGDGHQLVSSHGKPSSRDIVQFVPFRKFTNGGFYDGEMLAKEVLAEIPTQLVAFMKKRGIKPNLPAPATQ